VQICATVLTFDLRLRLGLGLGSTLGLGLGLVGIVDFRNNEPESSQETFTPTLVMVPFCCELGALMMDRQTDGQDTYCSIQDDGTVQFAFEI